MIGGGTLGPLRLSSCRPPGRSATFSNSPEASARSPPDPAE